MSTCTHEPSSPIAAFFFTCKHCGDQIESVGDCLECDGIGSGPMLIGGNIEHYACKSCNGTGVDHWEVMK